MPDARGLITREDHDNKLRRGPADELDRIAKLEMVVALLIQQTVPEWIERNMLMEFMGIKDTDTGKAWMEFRRIYLEKLNAERRDY